MVSWKEFVHQLFNSEGLKHQKFVPSHIEGALSAETDGPGVK